MARFKTAKLVFCLAALLFAAKPFIGFALARHLRSPVKTNILAKAFSKRKVDDGRSAMIAIQKQLSEPATGVLLRFSFLLAILFPLAFTINEEVTAQFLHCLQLGLVPQRLSLFTGQLII